MSQPTASAPTAKLPLPMQQFRPGLLPHQQARPQRDAGDGVAARQDAADEAYPVNT